MVNQLLRVNAQSVAQECTRLELPNFLEDPSKEREFPHYPSRDIKKPLPIWKGFFIDKIPIFFLYFYCQQAKTPRFEAKQYI